jgi:hypothetical protein
LAQDVVPLFEESTGLRNPVQTLHGFRRLLERLMAHLCSAAGTTFGDGGFTKSRERLVSADVVPRDLAPYLDFWWDISSIGSHIQAKMAADWRDHLETCRTVVAIVLEWYAKRYPPIDLSSDERAYELQQVNALARIPFSKVVYPSYKDFRELLADQDIIVFQGRAWSGKTSLASLLTSECIEAGYIPLLFKERSLMSLHNHIPIREDGNRHLSLNEVAGPINKFVSTRLMYGNSFVAFFDDPFGHRRFRRVNPLARLRISRWRSLSREQRTLGKLKIIITTSADFLERAKDSRPNREMDQIERENIALLTGPWVTKIRLSDYTKDEIQAIVTATAKSMACEWAAYEDPCWFVAEALVETDASFDALYSYCRHANRWSVEGVAEQAYEYLEAHRHFEARLEEASVQLRKYLCVCLVAEYVVELYREWLFPPNVKFDALCEAVDVGDLLADPEESTSVAQWVEEDPGLKLGGSPVPVFRHPEIRSVVEDWARESGSEIVAQLIDHLCGWRALGAAVTTWEALPISCRFAKFLDVELCELINERIFTRGKFALGDPGDVINAIVDNWYHLSGSRLERAALGFLKRIKNEFKGHIRPLIWALANSWDELTEEPRDLFLDFNAERRPDEIKPRSDPESIMTFLAAVFANYHAIRAAARAGSPASEQCLALVQHFVTVLLQNRDRGVFPSRRGDRLYDNPALSLTGRKLLSDLISFGLAYGALDEEDAMVAQIRAQL